MMNNMGDMMKKAQKMQEEMQKAQEEIAKAEVTGEAGAGLVKVTMNGRHDVRKVDIDPSLMSEEKDILEGENVRYDVGHGSAARFQDAVLNFILQPFEDLSWRSAPWLMSL